jgi:hypothetical protein
MPVGLAEVAWTMLDGRLGDESRGPGKSFGHLVVVPDDADVQSRLLGYCGRAPRSRRTVVAV